METWNELKILYVEDDDDARKGLERFLRRRFGKVFSAIDAEQGIEIFKEQEPDICIVDILLPGMNGLDMIRKMRGIYPRCRYLVTSTVKDVGIILEAVDLKIESYILKPIDTDDLEIKLKSTAESIICERDLDGRIKVFSEIQDKKNIEEELRKGIVALIKRASGKGPRDVVVFMAENYVDIVVYGSFTVLERTLLNDVRNAGHVEEGRKLFYKFIERQISGLIKNNTGAITHLIKIQVNCDKDHEKLTFMIDL